MPYILVELAVLSHVPQLQGHFYRSWVLKQVPGLNLHEDLLPRRAERSETSELTCEGFWS